MSLIKLAVESFRYYLRTHLVLALGVAAATAVLVGALIVGDSMRSSLRKLALDRLGGIDEIIVADGFFREELAYELTKSDAFESAYSRAEPVIFFPNGSVQIGDEFSSGENSILKRVSKVNVLGIRPQFWELAENLDLPSISGGQVIINRELASQLNLSEVNGDSPSITLRIPKPSQLSSDSALGKKDNLLESFVDLEIKAIVPNESLGRFNLNVSQLDSPNIFVPIEFFQEALCRDALKYKREPVANAILLSGVDGDAPQPHSTSALLKAMKPSLSDLGLSIKEVSQIKADADEVVFDYFSLSSDRLVIADEIASAVRNAFPKAVGVFTYLANDIRLEKDEAGIPFSMIASIDFGDEFPLKDVDGNRIPPLQRFEIVLNEWAAADLNAKVGSRIKVTYFEPEATHGEGIERQTEFEVVAIAKLARPDSPFQLKRRKLVPAQFLNESPTLANDPDLTPGVPGLTDAESIEKWDLPFATADKLRPADDDYWNDFRTTPKAFVSLQKGQQLWQSRFGKITSFRIPRAAGKRVEVEKILLESLHAADRPHSFSIIPVKSQAIKASSGSTPFDGLFLALSMFVIGAALILVSLLFRLTLQRRSVETGTLLAVGLDRGSVGRAMVMEMTGVALLGVVVGLAIGVGYAAVMVHGLKTWWLGAISKPVLELYLAPWVLGLGAFSGLFICLVTIAYSLRSTRKIPVRQMLGGELESNLTALESRKVWIRWVIVGLFLFAIILSVVASFLGGEPQAGAFMGAGFLVLAALLLSIYRYLVRPETNTKPKMSLVSLASMSAKRNPLRTTLTVGLVAVASFLIIAVSSFRLTTSDAGTGGFGLLATSDRPIFDRLQDETKFNIRSFSLRYKSGEDASCNNLYQSTQPQVLGVSKEFVRYFNETESSSFRWSSTLANREDEWNNPWWLLQRQSDDDAIPVIIDKNTANYSLKIFAVGGVYEVNFESGESVRFRVAGFLENSILQGSLIISEENFIRIFPQISGYRKFLARLIEPNPGDFEKLSSELEEKYSDSGLDVESTTTLLAKFQQVQNTYISTFQTLGALGLLLGTFGLAVVQIRSVLERQQELGLMRSVGIRMSQLNRMILLENIWLLFCGLSVGIGSALVTTLPHYVIGGASIPWLDLTVLFCLIIIFGLIAAWIAVRSIAKVPLIESLRA